MAYGRKLSFATFPVIADSQGTWLWQLVLIVWDCSSVSQLPFTELLMPYSAELTLAKEDL